jgi:hypothetical protein
MNGDVLCSFGTAVAVNEVGTVNHLNGSGTGRLTGNRLRVMTLQLQLRVMTLQLRAGTSVIVVVIIL